MNTSTSDEIDSKESSARVRKIFGWRFWLFLAVTLVVLSALISPLVIRCQKKPDQTEATSNLRQIGLALFEFESEYGSYPNEATVAIVTKKHPNHGYDLSGTSSNALFRQLFAAGVTTSEQMFYAKVEGTKKPDGNFHKEAVLEPGEVGFGYIAGLSSAGNPAQVIAFCPIIPGTDRFDPKPFKGSAVFLRKDNSVSSLKIDKNGHVIVRGKNILSSEHDVGNGIPLDIRYPELPVPHRYSFFRKFFSN